MRRDPWRREVAGFAAVLAVVVALSGCVTTPQAAPGGVIRVAVTEPQRPLTPAHADDPAVARILPALTAGLVAATPEGDVVNELAASVTASSNNRVFEVAIKRRAEFSDGEPVTAASFVEAWRQAALPGSGHPGRTAFASIKGYRAAEPAEAEGADAEGADADPGDLVAAGGLDVVDDTHFTITLAAPHAEFVSELAQTAFLPLPAAAFHDPEGFASNPVGAGPYRFAGAAAWHPGDRLELEPNPGYAGRRVPQNSGISLRFFDDEEIAIAELVAGEIDVVDRLPAGSSAELADRLGGRMVEQPLPELISLVVAGTHPHMHGEEGRLRRAAMALAIDRSRTAEEVLLGDAVPVSSFLPPGVPAGQFAAPWRDRANDILAEVRWDEADEFQRWGSSITIAVVDGSRAEAIAEFVAQRFTQAFIIDVVVLRFRSEEELVAQLAEEQIPAFRIREARIPSPAVGAALVATVPEEEMASASLKALAALAKAPDAATAAELAVQVETALSIALPVLPIVTPTVSAGYGTGVEGVRLGWTGALEYWAVIPAASPEQ